MTRAEMLPHGNTTVCQQLMAYFHKYNLLCTHQYGFRAKNQTTHLVHSMLNSISENMTQGRCTIASFIDLSKAVDCLQYDKLFTKMQYIGFINDTIKWFQDYLTNRQQVVDVDSCLLYTSPSPRDRTRSRMPSSA